MAAPVIIAAAGALAQAYQSEKARRASAEELAKIKAMFEKIVPPQYDMSIEDPPDMIDQIIPPSAYDFSNVTPKDFEMVGRYAPEIAPMIAEQKPELLKETADTKAGRDAQRAALQEMRKRASGESLEMKGKIDQASRKAQIGAQSRQQSILQDAQRRGQLGSGAMLAAQLQGASSDMDRAAMESQNAAIEADRQALQAMRESGQMGRQLAEDDLNQQSSNINIINAFNQRASKQAQDWQNQRAATINAAQLRNLETEQDIANRNTTMGNEAMWRNKEMQNQMMDAQRQQRVGERGYQRDRYLDREGQRSALNNLKGKQYDTNMSHAGALAGQGYAGIQQNEQTTRDRNQMIQSGTDIYGAYANKQDAADERERDRELKYDQQYGRGSYKKDYGS